MDFHVGIDVALRQHRCAVLDRDGEAVGQSFSIEATAQGFARLLEELGKRGAVPERTVIGLEATGHLWENLESYLVEHGYLVRVFNPLLTRRYHDLAGKRAKTDDVDAYVIAGLLRSGEGAGSYVPDESIQSLRELVRLRASVLHNRQDLRRRIVSLLQLVFPEHSEIFSDPLSVTARAIFHAFPTAGDLSQVSPSRMIRTVRAAGGKGFTQEQARRLIDLARQSIYSGKAQKARALSLRVLLDQFAACQRGIEELDQAAETILHQSLPRSSGGPTDAQILLSLPGFGPKTATDLLGEVGDVRRFDSSKAVVAYIGYYPWIEQSGERSRCVHLWPGGSRIARRALYMAAVNATRRSPEIRTIYQRKRSQGKTPKQALIVVAVKLAGVLWSTIRHGTLYDPSRVLVVSS